MRRTPLPLLCLMLVACSNRAEPPRAPDFTPIATDPVIARALNDPLMTDPDLASRNEADAVIGFVDSAALPVLAATSEQVSKTRDAWRLELLDGGSIPDLPPASAPLPGTAAPRLLGPLASAADLLAALGAPDRCAALLRQDFAFAANLPPVATIMPLGMVVQAGGADIAPCRIRIVRYHTAAVPEDALQYHAARAARAGLRITRQTQPEASIAARGTNGETLVVHARAAAHGLTGVTLLYRAP